jgi:hypothetical protein
LSKDSDFIFDPDEFDANVEFELDDQPAAFAEQNIRGALATVWEFDGEHIGGGKINRLVPACYQEATSCKHFGRTCVTVPHDALPGGGPNGVTLLLLHGSVFSLPHCLRRANVQQLCGSVWICQL